MAKPKRKNPETVAVCLNIPTKLMKVLDKRLADLRAKEEYAYISRSAFVSHALGEWCRILDDAAYEPAPAQEVRRRLRPKPRTTPNGMSKLTPKEVVAIRKDRRPFRAIARDLGVAASTIARARSGATWGWVT